MLALVLSRSDNLRGATSRTYTKSSAIEVQSRRRYVWHGKRPGITPTVGCNRRVRRHRVYPGTTVATRVVLVDFKISRPYNIKSISINQINVDANNLKGLHNFELYSITHSYYRIWMQTVRYPKNSEALSKRRHCLPLTTALCLLISITQQLNITVLLYTSSRLTRDGHALLLDPF